MFTFPRKQTVGELLVGVQKQITEVQKQLAAEKELQVLEMRGNRIDNTVLCGYDPTLTAATDEEDIEQVERNRAIFFFLHTKCV